MRGRSGIAVVTILLCLCLGFAFADLATGQNPFDIDIGTSSKAGKSGPAQTLAPTSSQAGSTSEQKATATVLAAGDIAECAHQGDEATAGILAQHPHATILTLGDNAYQRGTKNAQGYWDFFGSSGGPYDEYYYSYDLGAWHMVVLNSDCWRVGGCDVTDQQIEWLVADLQSHRNRCTLAYWHRPPFTSGRYGLPKDTNRVLPLWQTLYNEGVDVLLVGHDHDYERFVPMDASGQPDPSKGVREFVVGTGGGNLRPFENPPLPTTAVRSFSTWGVLRLSLAPGKYAWRFLPVTPGGFTDSGTGACH
jgi:hypothetical protein